MSLPCWLREREKCRVEKELRTVQVCSLCTSVHISNQIDKLIRILEGKGTGEEK